MSQKQSSEQKRMERKPCIFILIFTRKADSHALNVSVPRLEQLMISEKEHGDIWTFFSTKHTFMHGSQESAVRSMEYILSLYHGQKKVQGLRFCLRQCALKWQKICQWQR